MSHTIAVLSQKGGTGKTTAVRTLADAFRRSGVRTLAVDLDPQGNLSDYFELAPGVRPTIADVLSGRSSAAEAIRGDLIPADLVLAEAELTLAGKMGRELALRRALAEVRARYDVILIDCPPSLGLLTVNALVAADWAVISAEAQYFALRGVEQAIEVVELARDSLNPKLSLLGILVNIADLRTLHSRAALVSLRKRFDDTVFDTVVRCSIAYAESAKRSTSILDHRADLGADYIALAGEMLARLSGLRTARSRFARVPVHAASSSSPLGRARARGGPAPVGPRGRSQPVRWGSTGSAR
jgi:chromosome partitioning protein